MDDGIATGATAVAALRWARAQGAARVVFATPVGPRSAPRLLASECDDAVVLETPPSFRAVGEWYERFDQVAGPGGARCARERIVKAVEIVMVVLFGALGIRSLIYWIRRPFEGRDARDHLLFALFVTGRVGLWLALAGIFLIYALTNTQGRAFTDDARQYDWFFMVFVVLAAMQLIGGYFLGRRSAK